MATEDYVDKAQLRLDVMEAQRLGQATDAITAAWVKIAQGLWSKYKYVPDVEEFCQGAVLHLLVTQRLLRANPELNLFSYFTRAIEWYGLKERDKFQSRIIRENTYRELAAHQPDKLQALQIASNLSPAMQQVARLVAQGKLQDARDLAIKLGKRVPSHELQTQEVA